MPTKKMNGKLSAVIRPALPRRDPKEQEVINKTLDKARLKNAWNSVGIKDIMGVNC